MGLLIFIPHGIHLGGTPACHALVNLALVQPPAIQRMIHDAIGTPHLLVKRELLHKALVRLAQRPTTPDDFQGALRGELTRLAVEQVGDADGG